MQVSYYNMACAVWEPLVEPVEVMRDAHYKHEPWELKMEVMLHNNEREYLTAHQNRSITT